MEKRDILNTDLSVSTEFIFRIKSKRFVFLILFFMMSIISPLIYMHIYMVEKDEIPIIVKDGYIIDIKDTINPEEVKKRIKLYMKQRLILFGDIIYAQCVLESNNFKSDLCKKTNNFLGMKIAMRRPTTNDGEYRGYAIYRDWRACINDYVLWQSQNMINIKTRDEYLDYLSRLYAEDPDYINKLNHILKTTDF